MSGESQISSNSAGRDGIAPALPVRGCVDAGGRLIAADPALEALQADAGARLGAKLAIPQLADMARLARRLGMKITREARAASASSDLLLWAEAEPDEEVVRLTIREWSVLDASAAPAPQAGDGIDETLRSPLGRIIDAAEGISEQADGPLQENYADYAGDIASAGRHLLSVIRSMSAQVGGTSREAVDLVAIAKEAANLAEGAALDKGVTISVRAHEAALSALGEPRAIRQILTNILGNAVRHSPADGKVLLEFSAGKGSVELSITDEGPGIAEADRDRVFTAYERAHEADDGGKGLGLAISRRLARGMEGDVVLDEAPTGGARFTLRLPKA